MLATRSSQLLFALALSLLVGCSSTEENNNPVPVTDTGADSTNDTGATDSGAIDSGSDALDTSDADDASDTADTAPVCTELGMPCAETQPCPGDLHCHGVPGKDGFCAPFDPQCGGFTMKPCLDGKSCLRPSGGSIGFCADPAEMPCICKPTADGGKPDIDGC